MEGGERREEPSEFEVNRSFHLYNNYILNDESPLSKEKTRRRTAFILHINKRCYEYPNSLQYLLICSHLTYLVTNFGKKRLQNSFASQICVELVYYVGTVHGFKTWLLQ